MDDVRVNGSILYKDKSMVGSSVRKQTKGTKEIVSEGDSKAAHGNLPQPKNFYSFLP